eukprot:9495225-Pyramimonas_sp.AAC.1
MAMRTLGRRVHKGVLENRRGKPGAREPPDWACGGLRARRRETAMAIQAIGSYRMQKGGVSHMLRRHDATNTFLSLKHSSVLTIGEPLIEDETGARWLRPGTGAFPGDTGATLIFARTFPHPATQHVADMFCGAGWRIAVEARLPWDDQGQDIKQIALRGF